MADYSNNKFEITILTGRIFRMKPAEGVELNVDDVKELRKIYLSYSKGESFAVLLDATGTFTVTKEANALLASPEFTEKRKAAAFVTPGLVNRLVGNFFIQFNKPASPTKLFNDEASALAWLEEQMRIHQ